VSSDARDSVILARYAGDLLLGEKRDCRVCGCGSSISLDVVSIRVQEIESPHAPRRGARDGFDFGGEAGGVMLEGLPQRYSKRRRNTDTKRRCETLRHILTLDNLKVGEIRDEERKGSIFGKHGCLASGAGGRKHCAVARGLELSELSYTAAGGSGCRWRKIWDNTDLHRDRHVVSQATSAGT
jgi:hypothetical protein